MDSTTAFKYWQQEAQAMKKQFYDNRKDMTIEQSLAPVRALQAMRQAEVKIAEQELEE